MAQQDFFLDIAMTKHPISDEVKEVVPREPVTVHFEETDCEFPYEKAVFMDEFSYEDRLNMFNDELVRLRSYYRPFMRNLLPAVQETVTKEELSVFEFRYAEAGEIFTKRNRADKKWETVTIPDYRGPAGEDGKWKGYYRTQFSVQECPADKRIVLQFQCVDYIAEVYVNSCFVGQHEGLFAPFSFDITEFVSAGEDNELVLVCKNDIPTLGIGDVLDGDKIYAATGPGWDDPISGWHHCPAGAGIFGKVTLETRPVYHVDDIFVRPLIDDKMVEIRIGVTNYLDEIPIDYEMEIELLPKNFEGEKAGELNAKVYTIGRGKNEYRYYIPMKEMKLWESETPYLYGALVRLKKDGKTVSNRVQTFGLKKFVSDETTVPKGKMFFNNRPIVLRGANEMGHLQQCVMNKDWDQLIDDILIAKICNMNYYRITQRPVQEEIYDYCDMLGMMHQCDLPLFGFLRRPQFCEAVRQAAEMEHLIRRHVSTVMVTFINEPMCIRRMEDPNSKYSKRYNMKGHRNLLRDELEAFFVAARKAIYVENPDRVIKNVEGDYDPPTGEGMPDFHTYTMWYTNHGQPIGKLRKGYLPAVKEGWMLGCGEYGAEGLDPADLMRRRYPKAWLETNAEGNWYPDKIVRAQTHSVQGDWYQEQTTMEDWVRESQRHQARATAEMTDAFRRRGDIISHTAIHLLIDAWPSGWMKTLVDCERKPKPAYFAYQDSLVPLRLNLYCDRRYVYGGECIPVEAWLLNDLPETKNLTIFASISSASNSKYGEKTWKTTSQIEGTYAACAGIIPVEIPQVSEPEKMSLDACLVDENGSVIHAERIEFTAYPRLKLSVSVSGKTADMCAEKIGISDEYKAGLLISDTSEKAKQMIKKHLENGENVVLLLDRNTENWQLDDINIVTKKCQEVFFVAAKDAYQKYHLEMMYNEEKEYMDFAAETVLVCDQGEDLVYTYAKSGFDKSSGRKPHLPLVKRIRAGNGWLYPVTLPVQGRVGVNANLDHFLAALLTE